jgi:signal transduction histidine kinase
VPDTRRLIIAPIWAEKQDFGVLTIRGFGDHPFAKNAVEVADLLARQLGLYRQLLTTIKRLATERKQQIQTWADVSHQLKNPLQQAKLRADIMVDSTGGTNSPFQAVRGLCRKAEHVVSSLKLLAELAKGNALEVELAPLRVDQLVKLLIEASQDNELMVPPRRNIHFRVLRDTFIPPVPTFNLKVDLSLLEQSINALFDNAAKYSFSDTDVLISGEFGPAAFTLAVKNVGLPIRGDEIRLCLMREWRSVRARKVTSEGSGIGLWIVDHIMKAHGGQIVVVPTGSDYSTVIRLEFP